MTATLNNQTAMLLRVACLALILVAPLAGTIASRSHATAGNSHGVGLALLVTLQRTSSF